MRDWESQWLCSVIFWAAEMCCTELRLREKTADVSLWQSFLPWISNNKAAKGKCHPHIIPDGPAWMNNYSSLTQGKEGKKNFNTLTFWNHFQMASPASWHMIRHWHWGGCDMPRSCRNKKVFLVAKRSGKWSDSPQQLSSCSSSKRWDGDVGFICEE